MKRKTKAELTPDQWAKSANKSTSKQVSKSTSKPASSDDEVEEIWAVRVPRSLLYRLRLACLKRKAEKKRPWQQKEVARQLIEQWLKKIGE